MTSDGATANGTLVYDQLAGNDALLHAIARQWLERHHPEDVDAYLERGTPTAT